METNPPIPPRERTRKKPWFSNSTYDALKWIAQILIPAIGTFYFTMAGIWDLPYAEEVVGSLTAFDTFLGVILSISTMAYEPKVSGVLHVTNGDEVYAAVEEPLEDSIRRGTATFIVNDMTSKKENQNGSKNSN